MTKDSNFNRNILRSVCNRCYEKKALLGVSASDFSWQFDIILYFDKINGITYSCYIIEPMFVEWCLKYTEIMMKGKQSLKSK